MEKIYYFPEGRGFLPKEQKKMTERNQMAYKKDWHNPWTLEITMLKDV